MPEHLWIKDIRGEEKVAGCYLTKEKRLGTTKNKKPFMSVTLADRTGEMEAKVWERAEERSALFREGEIIQINGRAGFFRDQIQITVSDLKVPANKPDPEIFLESTPNDPSKMFSSLKEILKGVEDARLRELIRRFLGDRKFVDLFMRSPAAKNFHHCYLGGLLEHTLSVCEMALQVVRHYPQLDGDLLLTSAFLHDIGKTRELKFGLSIDYSDEGRLIGHVVLGAAMVDEKLKALKNFPDELATLLKHMVLSHHGQYDFGSPKAPKFLEAFALNLIDDLDAKINGLGRFMERDRHEGEWTEFNRMFGRYFLKNKAVPVVDEPVKKSQKEEKQGSLF